MTTLVDDRLSVDIWVDDEVTSLDDDALSFSAGVSRAKGLAGVEQDYLDTAFVPRPPWQGYDVGRYRTRVSSAGAGKTILLRALPASLLLAFWDLALERCSAEAAFRATAAFAQAYEGLTRHVAGWLSPDEGRPGWAMAGTDTELTRQRADGDLGDFGLAVDVPNRLTTSYSRGQGQYVGLHVDNWDDLPLSERHRSRTRVVVNLGRGPRWLLFVGRNLQEIRAGFGAGSYSAKQVADLFLGDGPDTTVFKLKLRPGEAYIAPTENIIHDGSTEDGGHHDVFFSALGRFRLSMQQDGLRGSLSKR